MAKRRVKVTQLSKAHRSPAATAPGLAVAAAPAAAAAGPMAAVRSRKRNASGHRHSGCQCSARVGRLLCGRDRGVRLADAGAADMSDGNNTSRPAISYATGQATPNACLGAFCGSPSPLPRSRGQPARNAHLAGSGGRRARSRATDSPLLWTVLVTIVLRRSHLRILLGRILRRLIGPVVLLH